MCRKKTELEMSEGPAEEAMRLRLALFYAHGASTLEEAQRICMCAMSGQLHGLEPNEDVVRAYGQSDPLCP